MPQPRILARTTPTGFSGILSNAVRTALLWLCRSRERTALARLDPHLLQDIGLDPDAAAEECAKPVWRG